MTTAKLKRKNAKLVSQVAGNIKRYRMASNLSQEQLREMTGLAVSRCESGKYDMTLTTISILSKHLKVEPYQLLKLNVFIPIKKQQSY